MREVSKDEFRKLYFDGGKERSGWTKEYWEEFFEKRATRDMKYKVEEPASPAHTSMMIVSDYGSNEYRLFFMTEEDGDSALAWPE